MPNYLIASSEYIRNYNVLLISVNLAGYLIEYYHQRKESRHTITSKQDEKLKELIACFAIHLTARTGAETHAWNVTPVDEHPFSLFVTGNTGEIDDHGITYGFLVGNILTEHIRHSDITLLHAQCISRGNTFNSHVSCEDSGIPAIVERFYAQSEQRPIRIRISENDDTALGLVALTGFNKKWFKKVDLLKLAASSDLEKSHMRTCKFAFQCDCSAEKLLPYFKALPEKDLAELYGEDEELVITCPRCGRRFTVNRAIIGGN